MLFLSIFEQKIILIFQIRTLGFVKLQNFAKNQKSLNLGPKIPCLGVFRLNFFKKTIFIFEISTLEFA